MSGRGRQCCSREWHTPHLIAPVRPSVPSTDKAAGKVTTAVTPAHTSTNGVCVLVAEERQDPRTSHSADGSKVATVTISLLIPHVEAPLVFAPVFAPIIAPIDASRTPAVSSNYTGRTSVTAISPNITGRAPASTHPRTPAVCSQYVQGRFYP